MSAFEDLEIIIGSDKRATKVLNKNGDEIDGIVSLDCHIGPDTGFITKVYIEKVLDRLYIKGPIDTEYIVPESITDFKVVAKEDIFHPRVLYTSEDGSKQYGLFSEEGIGVKMLITEEELLNKYVIVLD